MISGSRVSVVPGCCEGLRVSADLKTRASFPCSRWQEAMQALRDNEGLVPGTKMRDTDVRENDGEA